MNVRVLVGFSVAAVALATACASAEPTGAGEAEQNARTCGGFAGFICPDDLYCDFAPEARCGFADQIGTCKVKPTVCTREHMPVCGCDGKTYGNACSAAAAGVSVQRSGACEGDDGEPTPPEPRGCGSRGLGPCDEGEFCDFEPSASCGRADHPGTCRPKPEACVSVFEPVCGCDGQTYGNACQANQAGVSVVAEGPCET